MKGFAVMRQVMYSKPVELGVYLSEAEALKAIADALVRSPQVNEIESIGRDDNGRLRVNAGRLENSFHIEPREVESCSSFKQDELHIRISGAPGAGKTFLMGLIGQFLCEHGFICTAREGPEGCYSDHDRIPDLPPVVDRERAEGTIVFIQTLQ